MPYYVKILALWILLLFNSSVISQQQTILSGRVIDLAGNPVASVTISLHRMPDSLVVAKSITDLKGSFLFKGLSPGTYMVATSSVGYVACHSPTYHLDARHSSIRTSDLVLSRDAHLLEEVEVTDNSGFVDVGPGKVTIHVDKSSLSAGNNAFDIIRKAPGIITDADGGISFRGRQGLSILIDGKPANLSSGDVVDLLKNTSGDLIDQIELISNPSSKYDAAGNAGVINIKMKKSRNLGTNGSIAMGSGYGENYKANTSLVLNHRNRKVNLFGSWATNSSKRADRYGMTRSVQFKSVTTGFDIHNYDLKSIINHNYKAGVDYYLSPGHTLGFMLNGQYNHLRSDEDNGTAIGSRPERIDSTIATHSDEKRTVKNNAWNFNYKGGLGSKGSISADLDYLKYSRRSDEELLYSFYNRENQFYRPSSSATNHTPSDITIRSVKLDYSTEANAKNYLEAGLKSSKVKSENVRTMIGDDSKTFIPDPNDRFDFEEYIHAAYINYNRDFDRFKVYVGLRGEFTRSFGRSVQEGNVKREYADIFPSATFSWNASKDHKVSLAYSRRINRPAYDDLNPFRYFLDQYTYREGNPYLQPEYSTLIELSEALKDKFTVTFSYNYVKDYYLTFTEQNDTTGISRSVKRNLSSFKGAGIEMNYSTAIGSWCNSTLNIQGYLRRFDIQNILQDVRKSSLFSANLVNSFNLPKKLRGDLSFVYESPTVSGMYNFKAYYVLDAGIGKSLLNKRAELRLSVSDILNSDKNRYYSNLPGLVLSGYQKAETRIVRLNFSYKFGSKSVSSVRNRTTGSEAESKRVGN